MATTAWSHLGRLLLATTTCSGGPHLRSRQSDSRCRCPSEACAINLIASAASVAPVSVPSVRPTERSFARIEKKAVRCTKNPRERVLILDSRHQTNYEFDMRGWGIRLFPHESAKLRSTTSLPVPSFSSIFFFSSRVDLIFVDWLVVTCLSPLVPDLHHICQGQEIVHSVGGDGYE